ncbi:gamma-glutamylcyclotransferase [Alsobacter sp. R-9]
MTSSFSSTRRPTGPRLTRAHVDRVHREVADLGPPPGIAQLGDEDYAGLARDLLASYRGGPVLVFAYGSLIWKPSGEYGPPMAGTVHGWHRSFCLRVLRFRGTPDSPGLMMALDRGGSCRGLVYPLLGVDPGREVEALLRREMTNKPPTNVPRWVTAITEAGPVQAIAFTINRRSWAYWPETSPAETARVLATACGHWGSGADYLFNAVTHLAASGIRDRNLWRLQSLVAEEIERNTPSDG